MRNQKPTLKSPGMISNPSVVVLGSRLSLPSRSIRDSRLEETEITAHVSLPQDGGWSWLVVACAFLSICILDGIVFTFGSLMVDMEKDLKQPQPMIALANSIAVAVYFLAGPVASALINRFGFRTCAMWGSVISSMSFGCTYFSNSLETLFLSYGLIAGMGFSLINMTSSLVVGFYFTRNRATALAITNMGSGVGVLTFSQLNYYFVEWQGWRKTTLLHSGLFMLIFFLAIPYRPLVSVEVRNVDEPVRTVTFLPNVKSELKLTSDDAVPTASERIFGAVSNVNYPTSAAVVEESMNAATTFRGSLASSYPSSSREPALALKTYNRQDKRNFNLDTVRSSRFRIEEFSETEPTKCDEPKKAGFWARLCRRERPVTRPMYRDDAFYHGSMKKLPQYEKSLMRGVDEGKPGLEYHMSVSRAVSRADLQERRGLCSTAVRRVLATMLDSTLLKRPSCMILCLSGFSTSMGFLVPYVYLQERNAAMGIPAEHNEKFISVVGLANLSGRLFLGLLANKYEPTTLIVVAQIVAGVATAVSHIAYTVYYQYLYCCVFGFCIASFACLKSITLVSLYGLDKLTNGMGIILMFQGIGSLFSTPLAGVIMIRFGYTSSFIVAGTCIMLSGIFMIPVKSLASKENIKLSNI